MRRTLLSLLAVGGFGDAWLATAAQATVMTYTVEATFLADLNALTGQTIFEGFEGPEWILAHGLGTPGPLSAGGLSWNATDNLRVEDNWQRTDLYGLFDSFGDPDIITVTTKGAPLVGAGGWFAQTTTSNMNVLLDGVLQASFSPAPLGSGHAFWGIIDTDGFNEIEFAGNGHWGSDDYTFGIIPAPGALALLGLAGLMGARRRRV